MAQRCCGVWPRPGAPARPRSLEDSVDGPVDQFYHLMDAGTEARIAQRPSVVARDVTGLWGGPGDGLFFDVTTLRLAREKADELRKKGDRQDGKPPRVPGVWALIQTRPDAGWDRTVAVWGAGSLSPESGPGRADAVEKAKKRWAEGIKGKGHGGRFLKGDQGAVHLNEDAIRKDEPFDGRHGGWTRLESETPSQV